MFLFNVKTLFREANILCEKNLKVLNKVYDKKVKTLFFIFLNQNFLN